MGYYNRCNDDYIDHCCENYCNDWGHGYDCRPTCCIPGPRGPRGPKGDPGPAIDTNLITLNSGSPVSTGSFIGVGFDSPDFVVNSVIIPRDGTLTRLAFSIRTSGLVIGQSVTATVYRSTNNGTTALPTTLTAVLNGPLAAGAPHFAVATGAVEVNAGDLISVLITLNGVATLLAGVTAGVEISYT